MSLCMKIKINKFVFFCKDKMLNSCLTKAK